MYIPEDYNQQNKICKFNKMLYGLKQIMLS